MALAEIADIIADIVESLAEIKPLKVIIFGSYAKGTAGDDSDLDIVVVLDSNFVPKSFSERMTLRSNVTRKLRHLRQKIPMDVIVYTHPVYKELLRQRGMFARQLEQEGKVVYEEGHQRVA